MNIWEKQYQKDGFRAQRRYPNEALIRFLNTNFLDHKGNILELGCGSGANLWMIANEGFDAYGIDYSPTAIRLCTKMLNRWNLKANVSLGDVRELNFKKDFFDAIVDVFTLEHFNLQEHIVIYKKVFECLKKNGYLFQWHLGAKSISFSEGDGRRIDELTLDDIPNSKVPYYGNGLTCFLTPTVAKKMLQSVGFKNVSVEIYTRTYKKMVQSMEYLEIIAQK